MKTMKKLIVTFVIVCIAIAIFGGEKPTPSNLTQPVVVATSTASPSSTPLASATLPNTATSTPLAVATALPASLPPTTVQTETGYYYAIASVAIRSCPNTDCPLVARLNAGDRVLVLSFVAGQNVYGNSGLWADVTVGNQPQFIYGELLSLTPVQVPVVSPPEQNSSPVEPQAAPPVQDSFVCPRNCTEARAWGWTAQEAARCSHLDRDGDGKACYND